MGRRRKQGGTGYTSIIGTLDCLENIHRSKYNILHASAEVATDE